MEVGESHAIGGQLVENGRLEGTAVTADVAVSEIVDEQSDDIRLFVFGKTGASQNQDKYKCEDGFHVISFWARRSAVRSSWEAIFSIPPWSKRGPCHWRGYSSEADRL